MLLCKWSPFLMRMMSPPIVGLIWAFLIGVSSLSVHSRNSRAHFVTHSTADAAVKPVKDAIHPIFAKHRLLHKTKIAEREPNILRKFSNFSTASFANISRESINPKNRTVHNRNLNSKFKVQNINRTNSTFVFVPIYSLPKINISKNSVNKNLRPIIISNHRHDVLPPSEYKTGVALNTAPLPKANQVHLETHSNKINSSLKISSLKELKIRKPSFLSSNRTRLLQNTHNLLKDEMPKNQIVSESIAPVSIKFQSNTKNGTHSKKSSVIQFLPPQKSISEYTRKLRQKHKRTGRNFDLNENSKFDEDQGNTREAVALVSILSERTSNNPKIIKLSELRKELPDYANTSTLLQNDYASLSVSELDKALGSAYFEKKAKNLTIYEILKPRLQTELLMSHSNISDNFENQNFSSSSNDISYERTQSSEDASDTDTSIISFPVTEETDNITFVTNAIEYGTPVFENSMVIMPGRSDSSYAVEYVMINRNKSAIVSDLNQNKTNSKASLKSDSGNIRTEVVSSRQPKAQLIESEENEDLSNVQKVKQGLNGSTAGVVNKLIHQKENNEDVYKIAYLPQNENFSVLNKSTEENLSADGSEYMTLLYESDFTRKPKMSESINSNNAPFKNPKIDSKMFYDYFAKKSAGNITLQDFAYPEFRPGNMFRYSDIYHRKPILDLYMRPNLDSRLESTEETIVTEETVTEETVTEETIETTAFDSLRSTMRVVSTFYPNRMQDVTMKFGNNKQQETTTLQSELTSEKTPENRNDEDPDDAEYHHDVLEPGFTMEKLAYLLIGTCCGLSILCLLVVVIAIKCRRAIVEKRLKAQYRKRMYDHEKMKDPATPWQQQMFDHFMYLHRRPPGSSCSSATESCNCRCVTWSLGARNLDATRPLCPVTRSSLYLYGQKRLPFGAASSLRYESMLGRKRSTPEANQQKRDSPNTDSSHENDSLDLDSDSREGDGPKQCTCVDYKVWPRPPASVPRGFFTLCPTGMYSLGNCPQPSSSELRTIPRDIPPPVTGSNYLDRSEGVVYWSSNEERLI